MSVKIHDLELYDKRVELLRIQTEILAAEEKLNVLHKYIDTVDDEFHNLSIWTAHCLRDFATDSEVEGVNRDLLLKMARIKKIHASKLYDNQLGIIVGIKESEEGVCSMVTMHIPSTNKHICVKYSDVEVEKPLGNLKETWSNKISQIINNGILNEDRAFAYEWDAVEKNIFMVNFVPTDKMLKCYLESWSEGKIPTRINQV